MNGPADSAPPPSGNDAYAPSMPAPRIGAAAQRDALAWGLAFLPLCTFALMVVLATAGISPNVGRAATLLAAAILIVMDRRVLVASGRMSAAALPVIAWCLVPQVYLYKRARRLGAPLTQFWISIGSVVAAIVLWVVAIAAIAAGAEPTLPGCAAQDSMDDVISVFSDLAPMRAAGIRGVVLTDRMEFAQGADPDPTTRICTGRMQASNEEDYDIVYGFEIIQGRVIVHVRLQ